MYYYFPYNKWTYLYVAYHYSWIEPNIAYLSRFRNIVELLDDQQPGKHTASSKQHSEITSLATLGHTFKLKLSPQWETSKWDEFKPTNVRSHWLTSPVLLVHRMQWMVYFSILHCDTYYSWRKWINTPWCSFLFTNTGDFPYKRVILWFCIAMVEDKFGRRESQ